MTAALDPQRSVAATGLVADFHAAGGLGWADVHAARQLTYLYGDTDERVALAVGLCVRALRAGSVCLELTAVAESTAGFGDEAVSIPDELWPEPAAWLQALRDSPLVSDGDQAPGGRPLRLVGSLLYLERYWQEEEQVRVELQRRQQPWNQAPVDPALAARVRAAFPSVEEASQRAAAQRCLTSTLTVIAGGPGTGKTTTIARILALLLAEDPTRRVALAAPTGKAATRMDEAIRSARRQLPAEDAARLAPLTARTLHRLLGWTPQGRNRFVHDADNPLPHDVVVVDELSMVSLTMMSRLLAATGRHTRLILVGDPDQLASVEAGAVLADITRASWGSGGAAGGGPVVGLRHNFRFDGRIGALAAAIRAGDADAALDLLATGGDEVSLTTPGESLDRLRERVVSVGAEVDRLARGERIEEALRRFDSHRLLCAHRQGPQGVSHWARVAEGWLREGVPGFGAEGEWYTGRPLLMTTNSADLGLYNGDAGLVVRLDGQPRVYFATGTGLRAFSPYVLSGTQTMFAMTVHKAQGGQFEAVSLILPPPESPLLTRELLYTAVTRATGQVALYGSAESVRRAIARPARRASGLRDRL